MERHEIGSPTRRWIGIRTRSRAGSLVEALPAQAVILAQDGTVAALDLEDEDAELDFAYGRLPVSWHDVKDGDDPARFLSRHVREVRGVARLPAAFEGIRAGDVVALILEGRENLFAWAVMRAVRHAGAACLLIPRMAFDKLVVDGPDVTLGEHLARLARDRPEVFHVAGERELVLQEVIEVSRQRTEAMQKRVARAKRVRAVVKGRRYGYEAPEALTASFDDAFEQAKKDDETYQRLLRAEIDAEWRLNEAMKKLPVWTAVLSKVDGCGVILGAQIIRAVKDIRRFDTMHRFVAFCGLHVKDGRLPRRREGVECNWNGESRQAVYQLVEQFNKRPNIAWGLKLREVKQRLRERHPEAIMVMVTRDGVERPVKRYADAHIHRMAQWRTGTLFLRWLYKEWWKLERGDIAVPPPIKAAKRRYHKGEGPATVI